MSTTLTSPALEASGTDPQVNPPPPPPASASNHPADREAGIPGEASADQLAALVRARSGTDQQPRDENGRFAPDAAAATSAPATAPSGEAAPTSAEPATTDVDEAAAEAAADALARSDNTPATVKDTLTKLRGSRRVERARAEAAEKAAADAKAEADRLRAELEAVRKPPEPAPTPEPPPAPAEFTDPRPKRESFDTPEAYDAAIDTWTTAKADHAAKAAVDAAARAVEAKRAEEQRAAAEATQAQEVKRIQDKWGKAREDALTRYPDYAAVAESESLPVSPAMAIACVQADNGTDVLYHLGKNPAEATRISALEPLQQAVEIGRLSATLATRPRNEVSSAPAPINPITLGRETVVDPYREETMDEVAARVRERESRGRIGMWGGARAPH